MSAWSALGNELLHAFAAAGWDPADRITLRTASRSAISVVLDRPYPDAPVSTLLFDGRRQDLAFEKPVGRSADRRHHVRFWQTDERRRRPAALAGLRQLRSRRGREPRHRRDHPSYRSRHRCRTRLLIARSRKRPACSLRPSRWRASAPPPHGRNGGGDPYFTDGMVLVGVLGRAVAGRRPASMGAGVRLPFIRCAADNAKLGRYALCRDCHRRRPRLRQRPSRDVRTGDRFVAPGPAQGDDRPRRQGRRPRAGARLPTPAASCPRCRSASPWSACFPAPSPAPRSASGCRQFLASTACRERVADPLGVGMVVAIITYLLADRRRAGAQADRAARPGARRRPRRARR